MPWLPPVMRNRRVCMPPIIRRTIGPAARPGGYPRPRRFRTRGSRRTSAPRRALRERSADALRDRCLPSSSPSACRRRRPREPLRSFFVASRSIVLRLAAQGADHLDALAKMRLQVVAADEDIGMRIALVVHRPGGGRHGGVRRSRQCEASVRVQLERQPAIVTVSPELLARSPDFGSSPRADEQARRNGKVERRCRTNQCSFLHN